MNASPRILFLTLTNDVGSERIVSDMGRAGAACAVLGPAGSLASLCRGVAGNFILPSAFGFWTSTLFLRRRLANAVDAWHPDHVVPLDELSALLLRTMALSDRTCPAVRRLIRHSLGSPAGYDAVCHRLPLMKAAAAAGVRTPTFSAAGGPDVPAFPLMVKRDYSSGSGGVVLVRDTETLSTALRKAQWKAAAKRLLTRSVGFGRPPSCILLQEFVAGRLAMHTVACRSGRVIDGMSFVAAAQHPTKGASTVLQTIDHAEMVEATRRLVAALGCSGFVSFDFLIDDQNRAWLLEMNARPIGSTHLGRLFGHDLTEAFLSGERTTQAFDPDRRGEEHPVVLFPKELERDPTSAWLRHPVAVHDVPWNEPAVIAAYAAHLQSVHPTATAEIGRHLRGGAATTPSPAAWPAAGQTETC